METGTHTTIRLRKRRSKHLALAEAKRRKKQEATHGEESAFQHKPVALPTTFEKYYQAQGFYLDEWGPFIAALRRPLPVTFRVSVVAQRKGAVEECLHRGHDLLHPKTPVYDARGREVPAPKKLEWVNGWQLGCDKFALKNAFGTPLQSMRRWLAEYGALGVLTRQEVVSMIPAALLAPEPHHVMLDMCASPGSKTTQLLEALHVKEDPLLYVPSYYRLTVHPKVLDGTRDCKAALHTECAAVVPHCCFFDVVRPDAPIEGLVIANDVDPKRAYHLVRRCAALGEVCKHLMVTCHAGQRIPNVSAPGTVKGGTSELGVEGRYISGLYDRIICDVPCSGDGTLRKMPEVWKQWHPDYGVKLHGIQLQIALRGLALLKVGGIMCYSTCTFNPIENEAVVGELLARCGGAIELMDAQNKLPIKWRNGIQSWKVIDDALKEYPTFESSQKKEVVDKGRFRRSMWPQKAPADGSDPLPLHRCLRLMPQYQDTGGFFVAMLKKVAPLPGPGNCKDPKPHTDSKLPIVSYKAAYEAEPEIAERYISGLRGGHGYVAVPQSALAEVSKMLGFGKRFEEEVLPHLFSRSTKYRNVTLIGKSLQQHGLEMAGKHRLKVVFSGIRLLEYDSRLRTYRIVQEGLKTLLPHIKRRKMNFSMADCDVLLDRPGTFVNLCDLSPEGRATASELPPGPCIVVPSTKGNGRGSNSDEAAPLVVAALRLDRGERKGVVIYFTKARGREHAPKAAAAAFKARMHSLQ